MGLVHMLIHLVHRRKEGIEPSMRRILRETHRKADGTYVDDKARSIEEEIQRQIDVLSQTSDGAAEGGSKGTTLTRLDEDEQFYKVVPAQNGRIFGVGGNNYIRERGERSAGAVTRISLERQMTSLQEQLATMVEYMRQYMPEGSANTFPSTQPTYATDASVTSPTHCNNIDNGDANPEAATGGAEIANELDGAHEQEDDDNNELLGGALWP
ncbi:PREDICTED: uncharacterized protein LOC104709232 [Camelina sativa]|uniref:Uncharacterized protein LOC104709232 n=1 Tax=Camelina sativa TaxID=90675 RepID=A0ABM0TCH4_CAMSA|nr:PREDICTED: uncharacterized protein LOC104709232 [Camelina sativa]